MKNDIRIHAFPGKKDIAQTGNAVQANGRAGGKQQIKSSAYLILEPHRWQLLHDLYIFKLRTLADSCLSCPVRHFLQSVIERNRSWCIKNFHDPGMIGMCV